MKPKCPKCGSEHIFYYQKSLEKHSISSFPNEDGYVDLQALEDSWADDSFTAYLECDGCKTTFNMKMEVVMTPEQRACKIQEICDTVENWDLETLIAWVKDTRKDILSKLSNEDIQALWIEDVTMNDERYS